MKFSEQQMKALNDFVYGLYKTNNTFGLYQKNTGIKVYDGMDGNIYLSYQHEFSSDMGKRNETRYVMIDSLGLATFLCQKRDVDELAKFYATLSKMEF